MIKRILYAITAIATIIFADIICAAPATPVNAATDTVYARVLTEKTMFYSDPDCKIVKFFLPYSYFVKVLTIGEDSTRVIYMDGESKTPSREGYIKTCDLFLSESEPENPYPSVKLTLKTDEILFADSRKEVPKAVLSSGDQAVYYGGYAIDGENFFYVYCCGYIGYVRASGFAASEIPRHALPISAPETSAGTASSITDNSQGQTGEKLDYTVRTVVIIAVSLVAISVVWLLFRPQNLRTQFAATEREDKDE